MTIASLIVDVAAQTAQLQRDVNQINKSLDDVAGFAGKVAGALGIAFSIGAVVNFAREMVAFASRMSDVSAQTGIGVEALQALNYAAVGSGVSIDQLASSISQLSKRLTDGNPSTVSAVRDLGLSLDQLRSMAPDRAFLAIADAIRQVPDPMKQSAIAMELFGRSGAQLLPLLKDNLRELSAEAHNNGAVISKELIEKADALDDAWARGSIRLKAFAMDMAFPRPFAEMLAASINSVKDALTHPVLTNPTLPVLSMSMEEADRISKELTQKVKEQSKAFEENKRAVEQAEAAHRAFTNWIGEREIEDVQNLQKAIVEMVRAEHEAFNERIDNLQAAADERQRILDADEAAWREHRNQIGLILMEQDRLIMESTARIKSVWDALGKDIGDKVSTLMGVVEFALGPRMGSAVGHMKDAWDHGRNLMSGIGKLMKGDFSGVVDTIMAGIAMIKSAWNALKGLFRGGEEGTQVNPARDAFLGRFAGMPGDIDDPNNPRGFHALAALLTSLSGEPGGGSLFSALTAADTMDAFNAAVDAIVAFLRQHNVPGFAGGTHGQFVDFGAGTNVRLHGRERVMTEGEGHAEASGMRAMVGEMRALAASVITAVDELPRQAAAAGQIARGRGMSHA